jgi:hypothetical protein
MVGKPTPLRTVFRKTSFARLPFAIFPAFCSSIPPPPPSCKKEYVGSGRFFVVVIFGSFSPLFRQLSQQQWLLSPKSFYYLNVHTVYCRMHCTTEERVQLDWQWPLSSLHSIMMVNSAQPAEGGGARPPLSLYLPLRVTSPPPPPPPLPIKTSERILHCKKG